jgi:septum formation protein
MKKLILASASPRRASLLRLLDIPFEIAPSNANEALDTILPPAEHVREIAQRKTQAVAHRFDHALVLGADTVVALENAIFEKPNDAKHAKDMLAQLSGKTHQVYTGLVLTDTETGQTLTEVATTHVTMRVLSSEDISRYVATGDSLDKAGAYSAQGRASAFIQSISGCFYNVVGLPLASFWSLYHRLVGQSLWAIIPENRSNK